MQMAMVVESAAMEDVGATRRRVRLLQSVAETKFAAERQPTGFGDEQRGNPTDDGYGKRLENFTTGLLAGGHLDDLDGGTARAPQPNAVRRPAGAVPIHISDASRPDASR